MKIISRRIRTVAVLAAIVGSATSSWGAPTPVYGTNQTPGFAVGGEPLTTRGGFEGMLDPAKGIQREDFSSIAARGYQTLALGSLGATLVNDYAFNPPSDRAEGNVRSGSQVEGRFNTTGAEGAPASGRWWETKYSFSLTFTNAISAFGFYGTDFGDFDGTFELELVRAAGGTVKVPFAKPMVGTITESGVTTNTTNGWLQFFAFWDPTDTYTEVRFNIAQVGNNIDNWDVLGFDDFVVGQLLPGGGGVDMPEPGSLALVGAALLGLAASRRRKAA
jgi:PEP-CTERM motif